MILMKTPNRQLNVGKNESDAAELVDSLAIYSS